MSEEESTNYAGGGIYRENIMDHYKNPRNSGTLEDATVVYKDVNASCGDEIEIHLKISDGKLEDFKFTGKGCAISQASTSILSEQVKGLTLEEIVKLDRDYVTTTLLGIPLTVSRVKCAMLGLVALKKGIAKQESKTNKNTGPSEKLKEEHTYD